MMQQLCPSSTKSSGLFFFFCFRSKTHHKCDKQALVWSILSLGSLPLLPCHTFRHLSAFPMACKLGNICREETTALPLPAKITGTLFDSCLVYLNENCLSNSISIFQDSTTYACEVRVTCHWTCQLCLSTSR